MPELHAGCRVDEAPEEFGIVLYRNRAVDAEAPDGLTGGWRCAAIRGRHWRGRGNPWRGAGPAGTSRSCASCGGGDTAHVHRRHRLRPEGREDPYAFLRGIEQDLITA